MKRTTRVILAAALGLTFGAQAATYYWDGATTGGKGNGVSNGTTGTWTTGPTKNWDAGNGVNRTSWTDGNDAVFAGTAGTVTLASAISAGALTFNTTDYILTLATFNLTAGSLSGTGSLALTGTTGVFSITGSSNISGGITLTSGTLSLNGATVSNSLVLNGGSLTFSNATISGNISETGGARSLAVSGNLTLSGTNTYSGGTALSAGLLNINSATAIGTGILTISSGTLDNTSVGAVKLSNNNAQNWNGDFTFTGTQSLNLGTGAVTMNASRQVTVSGGTLTVGGAIAGTGFNLTKAGAGTLTLTGVSTYSGTTTISAGTLEVGNGTTDGSIASSANIVNNSALVYNLAGSRTYGNTISGTGNLTKAGAGTLTLSGSNSYGGGTTLSSGQLNINSAPRSVRAP